MIGATRETVTKAINELKEKDFLTYNSDKEIVLNEVKWFFASISVVTMAVVVLILYSYEQITLTGTVLIGTLFMLYQ